MKHKLAKTLRILMVAPIMALITLCTLYFSVPKFFGENILRFFLSLLFLTVLPLLAYPLQPVVPGFRGKGREGQRNLAMVFALVGYILGCVSNIFIGAPTQLWLVYVEYLVSGILVVLINKAFKLRVSAHACGVAGPAVMLFYFGIPMALAVGAVLYVGAFWSSIVMKRHTWQQFAGGSVIPIVTLAVLHFLFY